MTLVFVVKETIYHQPVPSLIKNVFIVRVRDIKVCRKRLKADKKQKTKPHQANIVLEENNNSDDDNFFDIYCIQQQANPPIKVKLNIDNKPIIIYLFIFI